MTSFALTIAALGSRTGRGVRVAVIDSGVHPNHAHVGGISGGMAIDSDGTTSRDVVDRLGHGTAVAAAIREKAPQAELLAVKVFDAALTSTGRALVSAIEWAASQHVHIINLSLGTLNQEHAADLAAVIARAGAAGAIIVSAAPQPDAAWLPGGLPGVIAVDVDWDCGRDTCSVEIDDAGRIRMTASAYPRPIPGVPPDRNFRGISFAVANATGFLALALEYGHPDIASMAQLHKAISATTKLPSYNPSVATNYAGLPGAELVVEGLDDLAAGRESVSSLLIEIGAPRLRSLGVAVPPALPLPEHRLYTLLARHEPESAHSRYNALLRRLVSFERALACAR